MLIGPCLSLSVFHPHVVLCGMIKVSITADSWHVGAVGLITMLIFYGIQTETEFKQEKRKRNRSAQWKKSSKKCRRSNNRELLQSQQCRRIQITVQNIWAIMDKIIMMLNFLAFLWKLFHRDAQLYSNDMSCSFLKLMKSVVFPVCCSALAKWNGNVFLFTLLVQNKKSKSML